MYGMPTKQPFRGRRNRDAPSGVGLFLVGLLASWCPSSPAAAQDVRGVRPLTVEGEGVLLSRLPPDTRLLDAADTIEAFLVALDGTPPDWRTVYGQGHHDRGLDERLFSLNRARDARREGNLTLAKRVAFIWPGELSDYDAEQGGYRVAIGPSLHPTSWGIVRFKPDGLPGPLIAVPDSSASRVLRQCATQVNAHVLDVVMTGRLVPDESIVYDFAHEEEGQGMVMPVIRIEQVDYVLSRLACRPAK